ncbi:MAG: hypothetical protein ACYC3I_15610 [Gemmataceae bacterium]
MQLDPIVVEIREIREHRAERWGYDLRAIVKDAQTRDAAGDREVVRLSPRRPVLSPAHVAEALTNG